MNQESGVQAPVAEGQNQSVADFTGVSDVQNAQNQGVAVPAEQQQTGDEGSVAGNTGERFVPLHVLERTREEFQKRIERIQAENEQIRRYIEAQQKNQEQPEYDPDHFLTYADFVKLQQKMEEKLAQERFYTQFQNNLSEARKRYSDFDQVIAHLKEELNYNPELQDIRTVIDSTPNAPFIAYRLGKQLMMEKQSTPSQTLSKINQNLSRPPTLASTPGSTNQTLDDFTRVMNMPKEEFEREWARIKGII